MNQTRSQKRYVTCVTNALSRPGSLLIDALLAIVIFGIVVGAFSTGIMGGQEGTVRGGNRTRAAFLAEEGLEAVRSVRDRQGFAAVAGSGVRVVGSDWVMLPGPHVIDQKFTRSITIGKATPQNPDVKKVTSTVSWLEQPDDESRQVALTTYLTAWRTEPISPPPPPPSCPDWANATVVGSYKNGSLSFVDIALDGNYAYVSEQDGWEGFHVFDISTTTPTLISNNNWVAIQSWAGMDDTVKHSNHAYVARGIDVGEIASINVADPENYTSGFTIDPSGEGVGQGLTREGSTLFLVRSVDAGPGANEYIEYDISADDGNPPEVANRSVNMNDRQSHSIAINGSYAYLGTTNSAQELTAIDGTSTPPVQTGGADPGSGTQGFSTAVHNSTAYLGVSGNFPYELYAYDLSNYPADPSLEPPPSPDNRHFSTGDSGSSGAVYDIAIVEPAGCAPVALIATDARSSIDQWLYFQAVDLTNPLNIDGNAFIQLDVKSDLTPTVKYPIARGIAVRESDNTVFLVGGDSTMWQGEGFILVIQPG